MNTTATRPTDSIFDLAKRFKYRRLSDVSDGLDAAGRANVGLVDPAIRPLWLGMKFGGVAVTERMVPFNKSMPPLAGRKSPAATSRSIRRAHTRRALIGAGTAASAVLTAAACGLPGARSGRSASLAGTEVVWGSYVAPSDARSAMFKDAWRTVEKQTGLKITVVEETSETTKFVCAG
jgi:hypothetical protein